MNKLALASFEDVKLQSRLGMTTLHAKEKAVQEQLTARTFRLEVKPSKTNDELGRYRRRLSKADYS
jgi:hypothetical protein